jgi:1-acyl-sn-glycerol-3-phosphate acyltransferase
VSSGLNARAVGRLATLAATLVAGLVLHGAWRAARRPSPWPRRFLGRVARIVGARVAIVGEPLRRDVVFVANHVSWSDILVLAGSTGTAFVAKSELRRVPLIGWLCTLNHTVFVERGSRMDVAGQVERLRAALADEHPVTIFPEGTTGNGRDLLPFKAALLGALDPPPPGVRVQPVRVDYGAATDAIAWIGEEAGSAHAARVLGRHGTFAVTLRFAEPFEPAAIGDRKRIAAEARRRIAAL